MEWNLQTFFLEKQQEVLPEAPKVQRALEQPPESSYFSWTLEPWRRHRNGRACNLSGEKMVRNIYAARRTQNRTHGKEPIQIFGKEVLSGNHAHIKKITLTIYAEKNGRTNWATNACDRLVQNIVNKDIGFLEKRNDHLVENASKYLAVICWQW